MAKKQNAARALSRNQRLVLNELRGCDAPVSAYALLRRLEADGFRAPTTMYRALDALIARGLARKISILNAFVARREDMTHENGAQEEEAQKFTAVVVCRQCGRARLYAPPRAAVEALFGRATLNAGDVYLEAFADCDEGCATEGS